MAKAKQAMQNPAFETTTVSHPEVACDGGTGALGHPRVFLHIDRALGHVVCPYCSKTYLLDADAAHG